MNVMDSIDLCVYCHYCDVQNDVYCLKNILIIIFRFNGRDIF